MKRNFRSPLVIAGPKTRTIFFYFSIETFRVPFNILRNGPQLEIPGSVWIHKFR